MNTIQSAYINALLADASYVEAIKKGDISAADFTKRLTQSQAEFLAANFKVKDSIETDNSINPLLGTGFDAVVWEGKENTPYAGHVFVSMRGTQGATDIADDISLAATGVPKDQIVGMVNWWMRVTTPPGQKAIQVKYGPVGTGVMDPMTQQEIMVDKFSLVANSTAVGTGTLLGQSSIEGVNGHSLGGYLATAFTRLFGGALGYNVQSVNTFNSAGFNSWKSSATESTYSQLSQLIGSSLGLGSLAAVNPLQTNYYADNGWEVTTNTWGEMGFLMPGFNQYGARVALNQEEGLGSANHSMYKLTDLLALGAALEKLDPTLTFGRLNELVKLGSNDMKGSYEGVLDALRKAIQGPGWQNLSTSDTDASTGARSDYHTALQNLQANPIFKELSGKLLIRAMSASDLRAMARNDFGALVALQDLSALSISGTTVQARSQLATLWQAGRANDYAAWQADKTSTTATNFTDQWLTDRAAMLAAIIARNKDDVVSGVLAPNPSLGLIGGRQFTDLATSTTLTVGLDVQTNSQIIFGTNGNDSSGLSGGSAADSLYGMAGDDVLDGKGGNDYLEGGTGSDTYAFTNQFGKDTILDSDGSGQLTLDGEQLQGGKGTGTANQWRSTLANGQEVLYQLVQDARSSTGYVLRVGKKGDSASSITINNADPARLKGTEGFLGIKLDSKVKVALQASNQSTGSNYWSQANASLDALAGKASSWTEGVGQSFKVSLSQAAKAGDTLVLSAMSGLKAILGDSVVEANGATITLAEGQTQVSFALISSAAISADMTGALSVAYQTDGGSTSSNSWGLTVKDAGETAKIFTGDQRAKIIGLEIYPAPQSSERYAWNEVQWAPDGTLTGGVAEADFADGIAGTAQGDKISGLGGDDVLSGRGGNDEIDGGAGNDTLAGGAGSDAIKGGAGDDVIYSALDFDVAQKQYTYSSSKPYLVSEQQGYDADSAADTVDAGDGNDQVFAGAGRNHHVVAMKWIADCAYSTRARGQFTSQVRGTRSQRSPRATTRTHRATVRNGAHHA